MRRRAKPVLLSGGEALSSSHLECHDAGRPLQRSSAPWRLGQRSEEAVMVDVSGEAPQVAGWSGRVTGRRRARSGADLAREGPARRRPRGKAAWAEGYSGCRKE